MRIASYYFVFRFNSYILGDYGLVTLHWPSNVDDPDILKVLCQLLTRVSSMVPLIFPVHPRTRKKLNQGSIPEYWDGRTVGRVVNSIKSIFRQDKQD